MQFFLVFFKYGFQSREGASLAVLYFEGFLPHLPIRLPAGTTDLNNIDKWQNTTDRELRDNHSGGTVKRKKMFKLQNFFKSMAIGLINCFNVF